MPPVRFRCITSEKMLTIGTDTMASAHFRGSIAVNPSNLFVLDCVAVGFFYAFGNPHYFHSLMELGINGGKSMPNL